MSGMETEKKYRFPFPSFLLKQTSLKKGSFAAAAAVPSAAATVPAAAPSPSAIKLSLFAEVLPFFDGRVGMGHGY